MPKNSTAPGIEGLATDYSSGTWIKPHKHVTHQIIHASSGTLRVMADTASWVVPPGRAIWMPMKRWHAIRCYTAVSMRTVYIRDGLTMLPDECAVWGVSSLMREIIIRFATSPEPGTIKHLKALLIAEIAIITEQPFVLRLPTDTRLKRMAQVISADPADPRTLADWARTQGISERNLIRKFSVETGMTFRLWRRQARLLASIERLTAGEPVTDVAFAVGYDSVSAYISSFRESFGETPGQYRNSEISRR